MLRRKKTAVAVERLDTAYTRSLHTFYKSTFVSTAVKFTFLRERNSSKDFDLRR